MEAGEYGLTSGTCFVARRLEVVAVAGLLWISWCVLGAVSYTHLRAHETEADLVCRLLLEKKKSNKKHTKSRRTQSTPRNPQQPGDRDHLETARDETCPTH